MTASEELCQAAIAGDLETIDRLLHEEPTLVDTRGQVREDHRAFMAKQGANGGWTPLHLAAHYGQPLAVRRLIEHGANVNAIAENRIAGTPLHTGTVGGHPECVRVIMGYDPDLNLRDAAMTTALELARKKQAAEIIALIEDA